ncbi:hypothetical protein MBLNU459_g5233t1 [Dothideomycetes sp. NU459]
MRHFSVLALAATSIIGTQALTVGKRTDRAPKVVEYEIQRKQVSNIIKRDQNRLRRRQTKTITEKLDNEETLYFANVTMGTPAQSLRLHIDTGSSDLWVNTATSAFCSGRGSPCAIAGTYSPNSSSTYEYVNSLFNITYVDGSGSAGDYATDVVRIGGATLENQEFGIGYTSSSAEGIIGIGYAANEAIVEYQTQTYANVPQKMVQAGLINSVAYSLWLNDLDASTGSILFGGINTDKYTGSLQTLPILKEEGIYAEFLIALTAVGFDGKEGSIASNLATAALLDSGTSLMYLPDSIASSIFTATGAVYNEEQGAAIVNCKLAENSSTIDFTFSGPTISVAMSELVIVAGYEGNKPICILGVAPAGDSTTVLGDTFLRSAYVVYDLSNNEISLAQTNFNATTDNVLEITNGTSGVPDASGVASAVTAVASETGGGRINGVPTVTSTGGVPAATAFSYGAMAAAGAGMLLAL